MSNTIRSLVKEIQFKTDLTLDQIAEELEYSPAYFRNEVSKGVSRTVLEALQTKYQKIIEQNGSRETTEPSMPLGGLHRTLKDYVEEIEGNKAFIQALMKTALVDISVNLSELLKKSVVAPTRQDQQTIYPDEAVSNKIKTAQSSKKKRGRKPL